MIGLSTARTRSELLMRRKQLVIAEEGKEILQRKLDVLMKELLEALLELEEIRRELVETARRAGERLATALALDGEAAVRSAGLCAGREIELKVEMSRVMGVPSPRLQLPSLIRRPAERGYSVRGVSVRVIEATDSFERLLELLLLSASAEARVARLGAEASKTRRRRNALDHMVIPRLAREAEEIERSLEERAREDLFRLKLGKRRLEEER